jgi:23S rRNA (guanosine2251-2'-O)-methyltransferase
MAPKKGPHKGTGGHGRKKLEGRKATPKATERTGHPAARRAKPATRGTTAARGTTTRGTASRGAASSRGAAPQGGRSGGPPPRQRRGVPADGLVAGRNAVVEALRASIPATTLYVAHGVERDDRIDEARRIAVAHGIAVLAAERPELDRLAGGPQHQGVALVVKPFDYTDAGDLLRRALESTTPALIVALDGVTDPHNVGAVARSAAAFGAHGLVLPERRAAGVTPAAWKASAGTLARLPVARVTNLVRTLTSYAEAGLMVAGLDGKGEIDLDALELASGPVVIVVGAEGRGLSRLVSQTCDLTVRIPLVSDVESLNASVAAGIVLAEVARRRTR